MNLHPGSNAALPPAPPGLGAALHVLHISTASPSACLDAVQSALGRVGGQLRAFSLRPVGARFEAVLRLGGLPDTGAERAAEMIAAWPEAGTVSVEHQLVRG
ncbi:hypothetical protein ACO2Q3_16930 [Caulobacter sp. KR2-114]|uniref:hypothetical protein n=1 Tax=Caulobacter sp. KR2-114 TaxID=3400912 RepID=UPI003C01E838